MGLPAPRFDIELSVRLASEGDTDASEGVSWNLSETGVLVHADHVQARGTRIQLRFPTFAGTAEVVWAQELQDESGTLLGMEFVSLGPDDRKALEALLASSRPHGGHILASTMDPAGA